MGLSQEAEQSVLVWSVLALQSRQGPDQILLATVGHCVSETVG